MTIVSESPSTSFFLEELRVLVQEKGYHGVELHITEEDGVSKFTGLGVPYRAVEPLFVRAEDPETRSLSFSGFLEAAVLDAVHDEVSFFCPWSEFVAIVRGKVHPGFYFEITKSLVFGRLWLGLSTDMLVLVLFLIWLVLLLHE